MPAIIIAHMRTNAPNPAVCQPPPAGAGALAKPPAICAVSAQHAKPASAKKAAIAPKRARLPAVNKTSSPFCKGAKSAKNFIIPQSAARRPRI